MNINHDLVMKESVNSSLNEKKIEEKMNNLIQETRNRIQEINVATSLTQK